jgi:hypothetical protein
LFIVRKTVWVFRESDLSVIGDGQDHSCTWEVPPPGDFRAVDTDKIPELARSGGESYIEMKTDHIQLLR